MRMVIRSWNAPAWMGPLLVLAVLALIPVAFMLAISLAVLGSGFLIFRSLLAPSQPKQGAPSFLNVKKSKMIGRTPQVYDAQFDVKETHEKE